MVRRLIEAPCSRSNTTIQSTRKFSRSPKTRSTGFVREPFAEIAQRSGVAVDVVMARIAAMLRAGTIRRVRQTLLATNLADGALVAWKVAAGENRRRLRLDVSARSVFRSCGFAIDRHRDCRLGLQTLDDGESSARFFVATTMANCSRKKSVRSVSGSCRRKEFSLSALVMFDGKRSSPAAARTNRRRWCGARRRGERT